jgi:hypothetical protein
MHPLSIFDRRGEDTGINDPTAMRPADGADMYSSRGEPQSGVIYELVHQFSIDAPAADHPMGSTVASQRPEAPGDVLCLPVAWEAFIFKWVARQGSVVCIGWHCGHHVLHHPHILEEQWYA